jgi:hypothetical protein
MHERNYLQSREDTLCRWFSYTLVRVVWTACIFLTIAAPTSAQQISIIDGATPAGVVPGSPARSYPLSGFEDYNAFSGALNASLPLYHVGGRGEAGFDLVWNFSKPGWEPRDSVEAIRSSP